METSHIKTLVNGKITLSRDRADLIMKELEHYLSK
ncbi:hypothetical protein [Rossellomorea yichunensis]